MVVPSVMIAALAVGADPLFPLPKFAEFTAKPFSGRASAKASRDRRCRVALGNQIHDCLNWMHGCADDSCVSPTAKIPGSQRSALRHIWDATTIALDEVDVSEFGAARSLLGLGRAYGSAQSNKTAAYQEGNVSLPSRGRRAVDIGPLLPPVAKRFL